MAVRSQLIAPHDFSFGFFERPYQQPYPHDLLVQGPHAYHGNEKILMKFGSSSSLTDSTRSDDSKDDSPVVSSQSKYQQLLDRRHKHFQVKKKTELCKTYQLGMACPYGDKCSFAHGAEELRPKVFVPVNYKTARCKQFFENGYCNFGPRCQFVHHESVAGSNGLALPCLNYKLLFGAVLKSVERNTQDMPTINQINYLAKDVKITNTFGMQRLPVFWKHN